MKAIIRLTTISELPCTISRETPHEVIFNITRDYATAYLMNNLLEIDGVKIHMHRTYVSVCVKKSFVDSLVYVY